MVQFTLNRMRKNGIKIINFTLLAAIIGINIYVIFSPLFPEIGYKLTPPKETSLELPSEATKTGDTPPVIPTAPEPDSPYKPSPRSIYIPKMRLNAPIVEGQDAKLLDKGIWHRPGTKDPSQGGNTVLAGHRFRYSSGSFFYHLPKLVNGDRIAVRWDGTTYYYEVTGTETVDPSNVMIENPTIDDRLTLYTCTPLWTSNERFVVTAKLVEKAKNE